MPMRIHLSIAKMRFVAIRAARTIGIDRFEPPAQHDLLRARAAPPARPASRAARATRADAVHRKTARTADCTDKIARSASGARSTRANRTSVSPAAPALACMKVQRTATRPERPCVQPPCPGSGRVPARHEAGGDAGGRRREMGRLPAHDARPSGSRTAAQATGQSGSRPRSRCGGRRLRGPPSGAAATAAVGPAGKAWRGRAASTGVIAAPARAITLPPAGAGAAYRPSRVARWPMSDTS